MAYNTKEINAEELFELLTSIAPYVTEKIKMYALGGTALTILKIKKTTRDVDINIHSNREYTYMCKTFEQIGFEKPGIIRWRTQEGLAFDLFHESYILGTQLLPDCLKLSKYIKSFGNIELYTLSVYDIIISKLARGDTRDFEDIKNIFEKEHIELRTLVERYKKTMELSIVANQKQKLLDLIEIKFKQWKLRLDKNIIQEVKEWEEL